MIVWLLIGALGVLLMAGGGGYRRRLRLVRRTPTLRSDEVAVAAASGRAERFEVSGTAGPGPGGVLYAPLSGTPCVWYRVQVLRRPKRRFWSRMPNIPTVALDHTSESPFDVHDVAGSVTIDPAHLSENLGRPVVNAFEVAALDGASLPAGSLAARVRPLPAKLDLDVGVRHQYREWTLPEGSPVYALGRVTSGSDGPVLGAADEDGLTVGLGTERDVVRRLRLRLLAVYGCGGLMAVLGLGIAVAGLIAMVLGQ